MTKVKIDKGPPCSVLLFGEKGGICMKGGIYSDQRCPICGSRYKHQEPNGLFCPVHSHQQPTKFVVRFGSLTRRFDNYPAAFRFLTGVRYETDQGKFDIRDYRRDNPLGFANLAEQWLARMKARVSYSHHRNIRNDINKAIQVWGNRNVKDIGYAEFEDFLFPQDEGEPLFGLSSKTVANTKSTLHSFWEWLRKRRLLSLSQIPDFPEVSFELSYRKTVDKTTQIEILNEIHHLTYNLNPRIWLGVKWLATYVNIRPSELINIKEGHIDLRQERIPIPHPKEKEPKFVYLIDEDIELLRSMPSGFPQMYFFRHIKGNGAANPGQRFGKDYLWKWWKKACANLGIEGVDLYGGTRHSSVIDLRKRHSPEAVKRATMHSTNKAFERYLQITADEVRPIYKDARPDNALITVSVSDRAKKVE